MFSKSSFPKFLGVFLIVALLAGAAGVSSAHAAGVIYVDADSTCSSGCGGSWANAHPTLQSALAAAVSGNQIWVAAGAYYPDEGSGQTNDSRTSTFTLKNNVRVYGGFAGTESFLSQRNLSSNPTILSGDIDQNDVNTDNNFTAETTNDIVGANAYHVVSGGGTNNTARLDGFIVTAGKADGASTDNKGGGMYNTASSPALANLTFSGNWAMQGGGGMYNDTSNPTLTNVTFSGNLSTNSGGGMYNEASSPTLTNVTFSGNWTAVYGGGMYNHNNSNPTLTNVTFSGNEVNFNGGGMCNDVSSPTLTNVAFSGNSANYGGGMDNYYSNPTLTNVTFSNNSATYYGGGMENYDSDPTLINVTFSNNSADYGGGGMYNFYSYPTLTNITFSDNSSNSSGGGMYNSSSNPTLTNVTFSGNAAVYGGGMYNFYSGPTLINVLIANSPSGGDCYGDPANSASSHNLIEDAINACGLTNGVNGNITGVDPNLGPLQNNGGSTLTHALLPGSPAIDTADGPSCPLDDQRGQTRPVGSACDIGAFEYADVTPPSVTSIVRADLNPTTSAVVEFDVTFSEDVTGVDGSDFTVTVTSGSISGASVTGVSGSGAAYTVAVSTGTGSGTLRLDLNASGTGIQDMVGNPIAGGFTGGEEYTIPAILSAAFQSLGTYDGFTLESGENTSAGGSSNAGGYFLYAGDNSFKRQYRSLLHFDTSSLPDTAVITGLTLQIKQYRIVGVNPFTLLGDLEVEIASPFFGTSANLTASDFEAAGAPAGLFNPTPLTGNWYEAVLNGSAFPLLNLTGSTQFRLAFNVDDNNDSKVNVFQFFSGNYPTASYRPVLMVEYYVP